MKAKLPLIWTIFCWSILIGLAALILIVPLPVNAQTPAERNIRLQASRFAYSPGTIIVNPGDLVTIELVSTDVVHGLSIPGYNLAIQADPGQTKRLTFVADRPGVFRFHCTTTCGDLHPFMTGKLRVGANTGLWRAAGLAVLAAAVGVRKQVLCV